jgi:hypothetical protein
MSPQDKCQPVDIDLDGEQVTVRVHGSGGEWTDEDRAALAEIVKAAIRKMEQDELSAERCTQCGWPTTHGVCGQCQHVDYSHTCIECRDDEDES